MLNLKRWKTLLLILFCGCAVTACQENKEITQSNNILEETNTQNTIKEISQGKNLIIYFSRYANTEYSENVDASTSASVLIEEEHRYGTTEYIARMIQQKVGGDLYPIKTKDPYPSDFEELRNLNHEEIAKQLLPELILQDLDISQYDTIFIGYPVWASTIPQAVRSFLSNYDLQGKSIIPFCTHDGYGAGNSFQDVVDMEEGSNVLKGLAIEASSVMSAKETITNWLKSLGFSDTPSQITKIIIEVNDQQLEGILYDTALAKEIQQQMPISVHMSGYGGREYYGGISFTPEQIGNGQLNFENGDITYCTKNNTLAIFYAQSEQPNLTMEVQPIGKVTSDLAIFDELPANIDITFSIK